MSIDSQFITIEGRIGSVTNPRIKITPSGKSVLNFSVAVNTREYGGEKVTTWYEMALWEKAAEAMKDIIEKGSLVRVRGDLIVKKDYGNNDRPRTVLRINNPNVNVYGVMTPGNRPSTESTVDTEHSTMNEDDLPF